MTDPTNPSPAAAAALALRRAAGASRDEGRDEQGTLLDAVRVHTARLDRRALVGLTYLLARELAQVMAEVHNVTARMERAVGGSAERIAAKLDGPGDIDPA